MKSRNEMSSRLKKELRNVENLESGEAGKIEEDDYPDYDWYDDLYYSRGWVSVLDEILVAKPPMTRKEIKEMLKTEKGHLDFQSDTLDEAQETGDSHAYDFEIEEGEQEARVDALKWVLE